MSENQIFQNKPTGSSVLITGGSGLIGRYLTSALLNEGHRVSHLSRKANQFGKVRVFRWDPAKGILDPVVFEGVDYIIHLAGSNIGEKRWTASRKREIENSRIDSAKLLFKVINVNSIPIKAFISASAAGYYGSVSIDKVFTEEDLPADDFLGSVCRKWEEAADIFATAGARVVKIRTGIVLEKHDSALSKLLLPARFGMFPQLGNGRQYMPWIHVSDLCNIYLKAIRDEDMTGPYNAVSPQSVTQSDFMRALASVLKKPFFHPPVPSFILKVVLGQMSDVVLKGSRISSERIKNAGYHFEYDNLQKALNDVLRMDP